MKGLRRIAVGGLLAGTLALVVGCSEDEISGPVTGELEVLLSLEGTDVDPNGGQFLIDGEVVSPIAEDIEITLRELDAGVYVIQVTGIAENCVIAGSNPRNVRVRAGTTVSEEFKYICESVGGKDTGDEPV